MNIYILASLISVIVGQPLMQNNHGVLVLNNENFDNAIRQNKHILVDFWASWCKPCLEFEHDYNQMAKLLYQHPKNTIRLAQYEATKDREQGASKRYKVQSYPGLIFFINSIPFVFDGGNRKIETIMAWMKQIIDAPQPTELKTIDEINEFISANDLSVLYFGSGNIFQDQNFWTFYQVTKMADEGSYGYTLNEYLIKKTGNVPGTLFVYNNLKDPDQVRKKFNSAFTKENVQRFVLQQTLPEIPSIDEKADKLIFQSSIPAFLLFVNYEEVSLKAEKEFKELSRIFQANYQFAISKITDELFFRTLDRLGADDRNFPQLIAVTPPQLKKYLFESNNFTVEGMKKFIFDYRQNKLPRFIKSEAIENEPGSVKKVVALTWEDDVLKTQRDLLLEVYSDWCKPCKEFKPQYDMLGFMFSNNPNIVVARINGGANEVPLNVQSYPTFYYFRGADKVRRPIEFTANRTLPLLQEFIRNHTSFEWIDPLPQDS